MTTFPTLTLKTDTETVTVTPNRVDLLRLERIDKVSSAKAFDDPQMDTIYRLAWLGLQRVRHPLVQPFKELSGLSAGELNAGVDGLAEIAELTIGDDAEATAPKASDPDQPTG